MCSIITLLVLNIKVKEICTDNIWCESALYRENVAVHCLGATKINQEGPRTHSLIHNNNNKLILSQVTN